MKENVSGCFFLNTVYIICHFLLVVLWIETEFLNPAVFEILRSKHIGVTSVTFQGHVTSSVTWPFDSWYAISYWWPSISNDFRDIQRQMVDV